MDNEELCQSEVADCREWLITIAERHARKVWPIYQLLQWKWMGNVPSVEEIETILVRLADSLQWNGKRSCASTGGLTAWIEKRDGCVSCGFRFALEANRYGTGSTASCDSAYKFIGAKDAPSPPEPPRLRSIVL